ncbi:MAG TPA: tripartite tricarboxylate transporter substrate binding protein [Syntrophorhabdales bacterium]|nr:tripartite tricarboxylate transporter substrate binding protein [Syntrophorhabdales bacterium]
MRTNYFFRFAILLAFLFVIGTAPSPSSSFAAGYPDHTIQLIIPNVAGAGMDISGRLLAEEMGQIIGTKIIAINKPGAGTVLGVEAGVRAKKDGYTLIYGSAGALVYAPLANPEVVRFDPAKDLEPLGFYCFLPTVVGVRADAPWKTFAQFIDYAKKNPGKLRITSIGVGSQPHFVIELIQSLTGAQFTHVPFEGGESVITAILGGHVEAAVDTYAKLKPHVEAGRMRILVMDPKRPGSPEIPGMKELGYKQALPATWFGMYAPAGIPDEVKKILVPAIEKAVKITKPKIEMLGMTCEYKSPAEQRQLRDEEFKQMSELAARMGLRKP